MGSINVRKVIVAGFVAGIVVVVIDVATGATLFSAPMTVGIGATLLTAIWMTAHEEFVSRSRSRLCFSAATTLEDR